MLRNGDGDEDQDGMCPGYPRFTKLVDISQPVFTVQMMSYEML